MKIRHLLLGLMICVAGTGAIGLSGGFLDAQNTTQLTPFLIFGHVLYEGGAPCNSPNVSITNLNTGVAWCADTLSDSNCYQTLLTLADVNAGDVLKWSVTDGTVFDTTNRTVGLDDIESDGIFDFDMILQSIAPRIIGYAPESPVQDIENAARRFNVTIDQVVDVTWLINSSPAQTNWSVTDASYTHTNVAIGVWNVSARASNANGTDMQEWIWYIVSATASQPAAPFVACGWMSYKSGGGGVHDNHTVDITNLNTGTIWQAETRAGCDYYELILDFGDVGAGDVLEFNVTDGVGYNETTRTVTQDDLDSDGIFDLNLTLPVLAPSVDVGLTLDDDPAMPGVQVINPDYLTTNRTVTITADVTDPDDCKNIIGVIANITGTGTVGDSPVSLTFVSNSSTATARYTGMFNMSSHPVGDYSVVVKATNADGFTGTTSESFTYLHEALAHLPATPFIIYGSVPYTNGTPCDSPFVVATNLNTSEELVADNRTGESFYQIITSSVFVKAGNVLKINASKNGRSVGNATYTVNQTDIDKGVIEVNINEADMPDFTVTEISFNPSEPLIGDLITINATIANSGAADGEAFVEFYDNKSITITSDDTITLPDSLRIRVHFMAFCVHSDGNITIYNETQLVEELPVTESGGNYWTEWCDGETIRIESLNAWFIVDRYEAVLANESITLGEGDSINFPAVWNLSDQYMGREYNGTHEIAVRVDPYNHVLESDETNNNRTETIDINPSLDFAVTNITFSNNEPVLGDLVEIDVTIANYRVGTGMAVVEIFYDNISTDAGDDVLLANETVALNGTESKVVSVSLLTGAAYGGVGNHTISVNLYPSDAFAEANETNNTLEKQLFVNGTDLTVTAIEIPCGFDLDNSCYLGQDVPVTATIVNIGAADATNFTVRFRDDANTSGRIFNEIHIEQLKSGETMNVSVVWNPNETQEHTITVNISHDKYTENNGDNNELSDNPFVAARYNFLVESVNVEPKDVRRGKSVNITATIGNIGHASENVSIAFFVNTTDYAGTGEERFIRIRTLDNVSAKVGENKTVSITWDVNVGGGCHLIAAVVNPDNEIDEINGTKYVWGLIRFRGNNTGNNVKTCTLQVIPNDLNITDLTLDPAEPNICEIVDLSAAIENSGSTEAESMVRFYMEHNVSQPIYSVPSWSTHQQPEDAMIRVHFNHIKWGWAGTESPDTGGRWNGNVTAYVNGSYGQHKQIYFYYKDEAGELVKVSYINKSMPCTKSEVLPNGWEWGHWYDVWTEWSYGDEIEISLPTANTKPGWISIDCYQVRLGNSTVTLRPGESMVPGAWNASPPLKAGEYYRLMANVDDQKRYSSETYLGGTDLVVTNLSVTPAVLDGDMVRINATIESLGMMDATDFIVNVSEVYRPEKIGEGGWEGERRNAADNIELLNTTHVKGLDVGNSIHVSVLWNASIRDIVCDGECFDSGTNTYRLCPWTEIADDYIINVTINPLENTEKEENDTNNTRVTDVHVDSSRDFEITDLLFYVNNEYRESSKLMIYDDLTLNATLNITNLLNKGGSVNVSFYIDEHEIGNTTVVFPAGNATRYAEIEWKVANVDCVDIPGDHNITVVVDPENRIYEIDENNTYTQPVHVRASDLLVERIEINPESPVRGETASINVTLRNHGGADANGIVLNIYDWAERHIEDVDEQCGVGCEQMVITRDDATAMRLYLDLEVEDGGRVGIKDNSSGGEIVCYHENFHGWTPWVLDNSTAIEVTDGAYVRVRKVYYLLSSGIINTSTHDIEVNKTKKITVDWNASTVGERFIVAIVDPEDCITESNEFNNRLAEFTSVQTADLLVSNLSFAWFDGTEIGENDTIKHGDDVRISADLTNIGVEDAGSFNVRFFVDDLLIKEETVSGLTYGSTISRSKDWSATVGSHLIKVEADYENGIDETNETNNIVSCERYVCGPDLSGNASWETLGLHGEILFEPDQPYDEDEVNITATINNSGYMPAEDFRTAMFFDYKPSCDRLVGERRYDGAVCIYLDIVINSSGLTLAICDGDGNEVKKTDRSCWVQVPGDVVDVSFHAALYDDYKIALYPIYPDNLSQIKELGANSSMELPTITQNVSARDYPIMLFIDPENKVPEDEDHRADNIISRIMHVKPTRDFTVTNVTGEETNLFDLDTINIAACVSNIGLRNGTAEVTFVDYEEEVHTYKYHFDPNQTLSYLPIAPDAGLSGLQYNDKYGSGYFDNLMIIHRPGVDVIDLHFNAICPPADGDAPVGRIGIFDENGSQRWYLRGTTDSKSFSGYISVSGETVYICTNNQASFDLDRYTTETEFHREEVRLNASKTWNESKNVTSIRTASTGNHTIAVTLHSDDEITEIDESNNEKSSLFSVNASREPAIVELNVAPERPDDGDDVNITAVITNDGTKVASFTFDLWATTTQDKGGADVTESNLTIDLGDQIRYVRLLNHSNLTLAPGENVTVQATWNYISGFSSTIHRIIAIVDPLDEIDEVNESNNEIVKEIIPNLPDLTIGTAHVHGGTGKAVVPIWNIGASGASDVTVRFVACEEKECNGCGCYRVHGTIREPGAANIQVHFDHLNAMNGHVEVRDSPDLRKPPIATYSGVEFADEWGPWVNGSTVYICCWGAWVEIDKYRWGNVSDEVIEYLPAGKSEHVEVPWTEYREPYDLNVTVDPDNNITELDEDNNNKTIRMGADISLKAHTIPNYLLVDYPINFIVQIKNEGMLSLPEFNVTLYAGMTDDEMVPVENRIIEKLEPHDDDCYVKFEWEPPTDGSYNFTISADPEDMVIELDESNNEYRCSRRVFKDLGYAGSYLKTYADGEVNGSFIFKMGDRVGKSDPDRWYQGSFTEGETYEMEWDIPLPADASIEIARLYLYWGFTLGYTQPTAFNVRFNDHLLPQEPAYPDYSDYPVEEGVAYGYNLAYGVYCYDVKDYFTGSDDATITIADLYGGGYTCIAGMSLVVVYESDEGTLTKYWINEGADLLGCGKDTNTPLLPDDCTTEVAFRGDADSDGISNATLITVVPWGNHGDEGVDPVVYRGTKWAGMKKNGLYFNGKELKDGAYICDSNKDSVGIDERDVKDDLVKRNNVAEIQDRGDAMMVSANGFLVLRYPPDLNIINLTAPANTVVGAHHSINATIRNDGRSDAHDFNVTFEIDGRQMIRIPHLDLPAGENMTLHLYNWTPMLLLHSYNLTVAADVLSGEDWTEVETDNNAMTKHVVIEEGGFGNQTGPRGTGGGSNPTGGEYAETITGRVMEGIKLSTIGGGGGAGMFSLTEWIMKGAVWLVLMLFVGLGYQMEQRSYGRGRVPGYAGGL